MNKRTWTQVRDLLVGTTALSLIVVFYFGMQLLSPTLFSLMLLPQLLLNFMTGVGFLIMALAGIVFGIVFATLFAWRGLCAFGNWLGRP